MATTDLERWETLKLRKDESERTWWHNTGSGRGHSALGLKVRATGSKSWIWEYRLSGGRKRRRTYGGPPEVSFRDAQIAAAKDGLLLHEGKDPAAEEAQRATASANGGKTVGELLGQYLAALPHRKGRAGKPMSAGYIKKVTRRLGVVRERWGTRAAASVTRADVSALLDDFNGRAAAQEMMQVHIGAFFNWAIDRGELAEDQHPSRGMKLRGGAKERMRYLNEAELRLVLPSLWAASYPGGYVMLLILLTGRRPSEVVRAEWPEFDLENKTWRLPGDPTERAFPDRLDGNGTAKNRRPHVLPLSSMALSVLGEVAKHRVGDSGRFLFHGAGDDSKPTDNIRAALRDAVAAAASATAKHIEPEQREDFTLHDLRRTAASTLEFLEAPDVVVKVILNHSENERRGVTAVYMQMMADEALRLTRLRQWLDRLSAHYEELRKPLLALPPPMNEPRLSL